MMTEIKFFVPGQPVAKARARSSHRNGVTRHYTPKKTADYERCVAAAARVAMAGLLPFAGQITLSVKALFEIPKSWPKKQRAAALAGEHPHTSRPDLDNVVKAIKDGCNGVTWVDDAQVTKTISEKQYGLRPGVLVTVLIGEANEKR